MLQTDKALHKDTESEAKFYKRYTETQLTGFKSFHEFHSVNKNCKQKHEFLFSAVVNDKTGRK